MTEQKPPQPTPRSGKTNWLSAVLGRFKGDADFDEIARAGAEVRATGRLLGDPIPEPKDEDGTYRPTGV